MSKFHVAANLPQTDFRGPICRQRVTRRFRINFPCKLPIHGLSMLRLAIQMEVESRLSNQPGVVQWNEIPTSGFRRANRIRRLSGRYTFGYRYCPVHSLVR